MFICNAKISESLVYKKGGSMNDNTIKCMYFNHKFMEKPQGKQCGWVQKVKLNKELKEKYGIEGNGYPCIIIESEV